MSAFSIKTLRQFALTALVAASLSAATSAAHAFSSEAREMCTGDAFRLCSSEIPNISKITACMRSNRANLSTGCRAVMDKDDAAARSNKVAAR